MVDIERAAAENRKWLDASERFCLVRAGFCEPGRIVSLEGERSVSHGGRRVE